MLFYKLLKKIFGKNDDVCYLYNQMSLPEPLNEDM